MPTPHLNPVLERCLAVSGRQTGGQLIRFWFLGLSLAVVVFGLVLLPGLSGDVDPRALAAGGGRLLTWVAMLQVAAACILTPVAMAATLQRDADPIAWDVQLATPLPTWRIVTGLLLGRLAPITALVLSTLPALLLLRVAGGVPLQSILASTAIALAVACTAAAAAVMFAAARLGPRPSIISYLVLVAAALGLTWGLDAALAQPLDAAGRRTLTMVTAFNPFLVLDAQLHPGSIAPSTDWWSGSPLRSFLLLAGATFTVCWLAALALASSEGYQRTRSDGAPRAPRPIGRSPIAWRESRGRPHAFTADILRWMLAVTMLVGGIALAFQIETNATIRVLFASLLTTAVVTLLAIATLLAASAVARERDDRTLDLLLATPLRPADYLRGKLLGLIRLLWPPTVAVMVVAATAAVLIWAAPPPADGATSVVILPGGLIATGIALPGLLCLGIAIGLAWSVRSRQWTVAAGASLGVTAVAVGGFSLLTIAIYGGLVGLGVWMVGGNPLLAPLAAVDPATWWPSRTAIADLDLWMLIGGCVGSVVWLLTALMVLKTTAQSFTMSVRRLAGLD